MPAKRQFFAFVAVIFESYMAMLPSDLSMISFMFEELEEVCNNLRGLQQDFFNKNNLLCKGLAKNGFRPGNMGTVPPPW